MRSPCQFVHCVRVGKIGAGRLPLSEHNPWRKLEISWFSLWCRAQRGAAHFVAQSRGPASVIVMSSYVEKKMASEPAGGGRRRVCAKREWSTRSTVSSALC